MQQMVVTGAIPLHTGMIEISKYFYKENDSGVVSVLQHLMHKWNNPYRLVFICL